MSVLRHACHIITRSPAFNIDPHGHIAHSLFYLSTGISHHIAGTEAFFTAKCIDPPHRSGHGKVGVSLFTGNKIPRSLQPYHLLPSLITVRCTHTCHIKSKWLPRQPSCPIFSTNVNSNLSCDASYQDWQCRWSSVNYIGKNNNHYFDSTSLTTVFYARLSGSDGPLRVETVGTRVDPHVVIRDLAIYHTQFMPTFWTELVEKYSKFSQGVDEEDCTY